MAKNWREVKDEIEAEIDRIYGKLMAGEVPEELERSHKGIFPSGAGVGGQWFSNIFFITGDLVNLGYWCAQPGVTATLYDDSFTLEQSKKMWQYLSLHMCELFGGKHKDYCPAPWLNLGTLWRFAKDMHASLDTVKSKEEWWSLLWSWYNYVGLLQGLSHMMFPWSVGDLLPYKFVTPEDVKRLGELSKNA